MSRVLICFIILTFFIGIHAPAAWGRQQIRVVGSSTVYPFTSAVAESFGKAGKYKTPIVEATGTGAGIKLFCAGLGDDTPDIANASRAIKDSERSECRKNGVTDIIEISIGFDGIAFAHSKHDVAFDLTHKELFLALAKQVPVNGKLVANPNKRWKDINPKFPAEPILVYGPPPTSGTRDAFIELVLDVGCTHFPEITALPAVQRHQACGTLREDGAFIESGENDNVIIQRLQANKHALGILGYSYYEQNRDTLQAAKINGIAPEFNAILDGRYTVARSLHLYAKKQHFDKIPGLKDFLRFYVSEDALGEEGYLIERGLIPLLPELRGAQRAIVDAGETLDQRGTPRVGGGGSPRN
ncbi:MAG: PstS family phosphate ABC transporter substrate-binding protein [Holosporales bacterium]|jgi:phosphate transport system substrate-binding protein